VITTGKTGLAKKTTIRNKKRELKRKERVGCLPKMREVKCNRFERSNQTAPAREARPWANVWLGQPGKRKVAKKGAQGFNPLRVVTRTAGLQPAKNMAAEETRKIKKKKKTSRKKKHRGRREGFLQPLGGPLTGKEGKRGDQRQGVCFLRKLRRDVGRLGFSNRARKDCKTL